MTTVACDPTTNVTRSLLGYGVLAGPFYVVVSLILAFAGIASGGGSSAMNLAFTAAVILASVWLSVVSLRLYKEA